MKHCFFKDKEYLDLVTKKFEEKKVIISSTDTIIGLMGPVELWAFEQLQTIKRRDSKPFVILISCHSQLKDMVNPVQFEKILQFVERVWPSPVTFVVPLNPAYKPWLFEIQKTVALRMSSHNGLHSIIDKWGPLFSTSVNVSGFPAAALIDQVDPCIAKEVELAVLDMFNGNPSYASTIVDITGSEPLLVRQGAVPFSKIIK